MRESETIWNEIRQELRRGAPDFKYRIWLEPLELAGIEGRTLYVRAPEHIRAWVAERYAHLVKAAAARCFDPQVLVEVVGPGWAPTSAGDGRRQPEGRHPGSARSRLNPRYTFEQFVIGDSNRLGHAAALAVAELPAQAYNPLFLHGSPGTGKTHLLHAIGNYVGLYGGGLSVRYATVDDFTREFVEAVRQQRTSEFKSSFRGADIVLLDDVQFLARRDRTKEELFHTFNALLESGRQLVLTSDRPPSELVDVEPRLCERFQCGLVVELERPGVDVRRAILEKRARLDEVEVDADVLAEIAACATSSVRALEGALIRVVAYASLRGKTATPALARHVLRHLGEPGAAGSRSLDDIIEATSHEFGVRREQLLQQNRSPRVAIARQVAMYLARELTDHSLPEIGRGMGGRNHSTVFYAVNRVSSALGKDEDMRAAVDNLRRRLGDRRDDRGS